MLIIAYEGTNYCGWQKQKNAITIEETINKALSDLFSAEISVIGASRTDTGVHAKEKIIRKKLQINIYSLCFSVLPDRTLLCADSGKWFWQSKGDHNLVILRKWIE